MRMGWGWPGLACPSVEQPPNTSGSAQLAYVFRPYQVVRSRKLGLNARTPQQR